MTFWDAYNPWRETVIYVQPNEWLDCLMYPEQRIHYVQQMERRPFHDLYILPDLAGREYHSMGMRYGRKGEEYFSPYGDKVKLQKLIDAYRGGKHGT